MVRVEMLAVGKELLIGRTMNSNAHWLGKRLARMGAMLKEITTVDDDLVEIASAFRAVVDRGPDFLIVVGGLGPTPDDMTLKGISSGMGVTLRKNEQALELIKNHYARRGLQGIELTPARLKMARLPAGAEAIFNDVGTAPGVRLAEGRTTVYCLPGVPEEMRDIFRRSVEPEIRKKLGKQHRKYITMKLEGILESVLAPLIAEELKRHPGAYIKSHPRGIREGVSRIELDIAVVGEDRRWTDREGEEIAGEMNRKIGKAGGRVDSAKGPGD
ncbi:MAG TPA: molybdopterin-binding protein [Nitrososphaerales archaeon]|nr:molybdopterin-binding protein [Nitrososphaerales archaeon]